MESEKMQMCSEASPSYPPTHIWLPIDTKKKKEREMSLMKAWNAWKS